MKRVTIKEAREILGDESAKISDEEVRSLIDDLSVMAKWALEEVHNTTMSETEYMPKNAIP